jgi:acyl-coenzyme A synthetase/AMP-(fatty) acid ligase
MRTPFAGATAEKHGMLGEHLIVEGAERAERLAMDHGGHLRSYGDLRYAAIAVVSQQGRLAGRRVGLTATDPAPYIAAVAALDWLGAHTFLIGRRSSAEVESIRSRFDLEAVLGEGEHEATGRPGDATEIPPSHPGGGKVTLLTSGTTGIPKAATHTWATLGSPVRKDPSLAESRWLCAYPLPLYAGIQVLLQAFLNWAALVVPASFDPKQAAATLVDSRVTHASGTPTFWRQIIFFGGRDLLRRAALRQVTLGGEAVTQDLLDRLRSLWPGVRIVHIYASTEMGRLFSVTDGREGFPARYLETAPEPGTDLRILDGELQARSAHGMIGYEQEEDRAQDPGAWRATGDLVEVQGDRVLFRGRSSDLMNVGGHKVAPLKIENTLRSVEGVADLRAYPRRSSLAGQIVALEVVPVPGSNETDLRQSLLSAARAGLLPHEVPRLIEFVAALQPNVAFKLTRKEKA